jgi:beta-galactosidase
MSGMTRRTFVGGAAAAVAVAARPLSASIARAVSTGADDKTVETVHRLTDDWELFQGSLAGPWEVWHSEELAVFKPVTVPHCFNAYDGCDPDVSYYRGQGWYRTRLKVENPFAGGRTLLHFLGAAQVTTVFVGETQVGVHEGGYDEFVFDITEAVDGLDAKLTAKGVPLTVCCDNSRRMDTIPSDFSDFSLYGGLTRHVQLMYVPGVYVDSLDITVTDAESAHPVIEARVHIVTTVAYMGPVPVQFEILDPDGTVIFSEQTNAHVGSIATVRHTLKQPRLWSPRHPEVYQCRATYLHISENGTDHTMTERFGIRHFEFVEHGPFKLNGERLLLRGTHRHEDHAGFASAMPDELIRAEMKLIKAMGANFIRLGHYQQNRLVLELCDELGILVWEEVPWCRGGIGGDHWKNMVREKLTNTIEQHRNHPSVILWGLGNEDDWPTEYPSVDKEAIRAFMTELRNLAHKLDPTRLTSFRRCDFARDIPDVYSPSIWAGWYSGLYTEYQASLEKQVKLQPHMLHIEWGADSHAGRHSETPDKAIADVGTGHGTDERGLDYKLTGGAPRVSKDGDWSETYACNLFDWHLKVQESLPWLTGAAQWVFKDFTTPLRVENPVPRVNQKGVIARDMTKKEAYFVFQSYWAEEPMVHIYGHTWPVRWGDAGESKMVKVYSNCEEVELFHEGKSLGVKRRNSQDFPAAGLRWTLPFSAGENSLKAVGRRRGASVTDEIRFKYETRKWGAPKKLLVAQTERMGAFVTVEATLVDAAGVTCLDARNVVRFSLAGVGRLVDNQGTPWGSRVVQMANGRARITAQLMGTGTVGVVVDGVEAAFLGVSAW